MFSARSPASLQTGYNEDIEIIELPGETLSSNIVKKEEKSCAQKKDESSNTLKKNKKDKEKGQIKEVSYLKLYRYANCFDYFLIIIGTLSAAGNGTAMPLLFIVLGDLTDAALSLGRLQPSSCTTISNSTTPLDLTALVEDLNRSVDRSTIYFVIIAACVLILSGLQVFCWLLQAGRQTKTIRKKFFQSILRQNVGFFDVNSAGELNARIADDTGKIQNGIADKVALAIMYFSRSIAGLIIGFFYSWRLSLVVLACSPFIGIIGAVLFKVAVTFTKKESSAYARAGSIAEEVISSIRTVVAFNGQEKETARYSASLDPARKVGIRKGLVTGLTLGSLMLIIFCTYGISFWYGSTLVIDGVISFGSLLTSFFSILACAFSLGQAASNIGDFAAAKAAGYRIFEIIDRVPPIDSFSNGGLKPNQIKGEVRLNKVDFAYPSRPDIKVLQNVSFKALSGQTTALCGQSGCGKSTCIQLIQRFYDPLYGTIEIDGIDIKTLNVRWLREHIGVVSQEPVLFDTTIAENIRYGRENVTDQEIEEATKKSNAYDFIMELPKKFETLVGEGGVQMSGGQKQRIAIARAIVRDPKILLLDEATSALDTESEAIVQSALEKASEGRTTILIAHRLSTIKNSNKIVGFSEGKAVEEGTHEQLLKFSSGIYQNLVNMQSFHQEEADKQETQLNGGLLEHKKRHCFDSGSTIHIDDYAKEEFHEDLPEYSFWHILKLNRPETVYIIIGCIAAGINGGLQSLFGVIFGEIISVFTVPTCDSEGNNDLLSQVTLFSLLFAAIGLGLFFGNLGQSTSFAKSGEELTYRLRKKTFKAMLRQEMGYYDNHLNSTGALTTRLATDTSKVQGATGIRIGTVIRGVLALCVALGIAFAYGWELTLLTIAFVPFLAIGGMLQFRLITGHTAKESKSYEEAGKVAFEGTLNIRTVASLGIEDLFYRKYVEAINVLYKKTFKKALIYGFAFGFSQSALFFSYAATFRFGVYLVDIGRMEVQNVFRVLMTVIFGATAAGESSSFAPDYAEAKTSANRLLKLIDRKPKIDSYRKEGFAPNLCYGSVDFQNIKFSYPTRPDVTVLKSLSITVHPGQTLALVGQSGCGKSTCIQMLERFYQSDEGKILLDNFNIADLQISWLRSQLSLVSQEPVLFDYSIADNIKYGDNSREVSMEEVISAAKKANIHDFIKDLPEAYETNVGAKGTQLSGGQKQRVAIARALIRNPKILLLDEATSALDTESEKIVQDALDHAREGRTCIVIAHRLSTVKNADVIAVMENGQIVECGSHAQLLSKRGSYYSLVDAQLHRK